LRELRLFRSKVVLEDAGATKVGAASLFGGTIFRFTLFHAIALLA
jgi:hypothetical protein